MEKENKTFSKINKIIFSSLLIIGVISSNTAFAATLSFTPSVGTHEKNKTFSVGIYVGSLDKAMNAASGTVTFPTDKLQVVSVSKAGTIIDFWAQEPSFSNTSGTVKFEGIVLPPGYQGGNGRIVTINFKGKTSGIADVKITGGQVLANDGVGTPILNSVTGATFTIKEATEKPEVIDIDEIPEVEDMPKEEVCEADSLIYSTTHPGQVWRKENTAVFSWDVNENIVASRIAFDKNPNTEPENLSKPAIVEKKYENLEDGVWYFHLSLQDNDGWSETEHFKIKIDTTPPEITLNEIERSDLTNPKPVISVKITDKMSCVRDFIVKVDGEEVDYNKLPDGNFELETIEPGEHELSVLAYDRAGNQNESFIDVVVKALDAPVVKEYQNTVRNYTEVSVKGETIQNANITAKITSKNNNFLAREDFQSGSGKFTWTAGTKLKNGTYFISFKVTDTRGASSNWSEPIMIKVGSGKSISLNSLVDKIPPEFAMIGLIAVGIFLIVLITRALTIRKLRREHDDWG